MALSISSCLLGNNNGGLVISVIEAMLSLSSDHSKLIKVWTAEESASRLLFRG
jgi:hypothetical protein